MQKNAKHSHSYIFLFRLWGPAPEEATFLILVTYKDVTKSPHLFSSCKKRCFRCFIALQKIILPPSNPRSVQNRLKSVYKFFLLNSQSNLVVLFSEELSCQAVYIIDQLVKLASITCLTCISFERYLTIAKPFKNTVSFKTS